MSAIRTYGKKTIKRKHDTDSQSGTPKRQRLDTPAPDLPHIFDAALFPSAPSTPTKLAKRMLGRSKTESSLEGSPSFSKSTSLDRTSSLPSFVSPTKPSSVLLSSPSASVTEQPSSPQRLAITNKRTYAGKSRSFLMAMPTDQSLSEDDFNNRESYAALRSRWGVDNSEDDPHSEIFSDTKSNTSTPNGTPSKRKGKGRLKQESSIPNDVIQPLKSITEIRNKGENRRFLDEVGYLLEGMGKDETPALKKASALEIVSRLCESDFARQAKAADFLQSTWDAFLDAGAGRGEDKVLDTLLASFTALVSKDIGSLTDLVQRDQSPSSSTSSQPLFTSTLFSLLIPLSPDTDPLLIISQSSLPNGQLKNLGITKADQALLKTLHVTMTSKARIFPSSNLPISNVLLLTHTLTTLPPTLIPSTCVAPLMQCLQVQLQPAVECLSGLEDGNTSADIQPLSSSKRHHAATNTSLPTLQTVPYAVIHDLLVLLDGFLLGQWAPSQGRELQKYHNIIDVARDAWLANGLGAAGITAELSFNTQGLRRSGKHKNGSESTVRLTEIIFRVLVSLTHSDPQWGQTLTSNNRVVLFVIRTIVRADEMRRDILAQNRGSSAIRMKGNGHGQAKNKVQTRQALFFKKEDGEEGDMATDSASSDGENYHDILDSKERFLLSAAQALDWLCLSLGVLTNLAQVMEEAKTIFRDTMFDPACIQKALPCFQVCSCPNTVNLLHVLVTIYEHQLSSISPMHSRTSRHRHPEKSATTVKPEPFHSVTMEDQEVEADASFLLGHLSVLFGLLMMDSPENQEIVLHALPAVQEHENTKKQEVAVRREKLAQLIENASELGVFYAVISRRGLAETGLNATNGDDISVALSKNGPEMNRHTESDASKGVDVAKGVISFLRGLRDGL